MAERESWDGKRERRLAEPGAAEAYEAARLAFELGAAVRELRVTGFTSNRRRLKRPDAVLFLFFHLAVDDDCLNGSAVEKAVFVDGPTLTAELAAELAEDLAATLTAASTPDS